MLEIDVPHKDSKLRKLFPEWENVNRDMIMY